MMSDTGNSNAIRPTVQSGGQTGVDRAALDVALALHLPCTGWCPRGRRAEDGPLPAHYPLRETDSADYPPRTERNVRDADATLILNRGPLAGGTAYTVRMAEKQAKSCLVVDKVLPGGGYRHGGSGRHRRLVAGATRRHPEHRRPARIESARDLRAGVGRVAASVRGVVVLRSVETTPRRQTCARFALSSVM
jgi:hypothetical protein